MQRVEHGQEERIARRFGNHAMETSIGLPVGGWVACAAGLLCQCLQAIDLRLRGTKGREARHDRLNRDAHLDHLKRIDVVEYVLEGGSRPCRRMKRIAGPRRPIDEGAAALLARNSAFL